MGGMGGGWVVDGNLPGNHSIQVDGGALDRTNACIQTSQMVLDIGEENYMHHPTDRIAHTTAFITPAGEH